MMQCDGMMLLVHECERWIAFALLLKIRKRKRKTKKKGLDVRDVVNSNMEIMGVNSCWKNVDHDGNSIITNSRRNSIRRTSNYFVIRFDCYELRQVEINCLQLLWKNVISVYFCLYTCICANTTKKTKSAIAY